MNKLPVINQGEAQEVKFESLKNFIQPIYLDNNSTTRLDPDLVPWMLSALEINYANPSGIHSIGRKAHTIIEDARKNVGDFFGCKAEEIVFTSCATESICSVINSVIINGEDKNHFITCMTEHGATLNKLKQIEESGYYKVSYLEVDREGRFDLEQLEECLKSNYQKTLLVSLMAVNNETGTIHQNLNEAIELSHKYGALFHIDAVQAAGKLPLKNYIDMGTDFMSVSAHKFHGPKGIGALFIKNGVKFNPLIIGGHHENGRRAGTENVVGIIAFGVLATKKPMFDGKMNELHDLFVKSLCNKVPSCIINGGGLPGTINVGFQYVNREAMVMKLSNYDVYASVGSACSKNLAPSHVLKAMKVPQDYIFGSVRFSMSKFTTKDEIIIAVDRIEKAYFELKRLSMGIVI